FPDFEMGEVEDGNDWRDLTQCCDPEITQFQCRVLVRRKSTGELMTLIDYGEVCGIRKAPLGCAEPEDEEQYTEWDDEDTDDDEDGEDDDENGEDDEEDDEDDERDDDEDNDDDGEDATQNTHYIMFVNNTELLKGKNHLDVDLCIGFNLERKNNGVFHYKTKKHFHSGSEQHGQGTAAMRFYERVWGGGDDPTYEPQYHCLVKLLHDTIVSWPWA
ncbi:MAG: hypothetical protein SGILL_004160, partial [Bacillariaceae sp.]